MPALPSAAIRSLRSVAAGPVMSNRDPRVKIWIQTFWTSMSLMACTNRMILSAGFVARGPPPYLADRPGAVFMLVFVEKPGAPEGWWVGLFNIQGWEHRPSLPGC